MNLTIFSEKKTTEKRFFAEQYGIYFPSGDKNRVIIAFAASAYPSSAADAQFYSQIE